MPVPKILLSGDPRLERFVAAPRQKDGSLPVVGWREWVGLPSLGIGRLQAKVDTGARTSALHANSIEAFEVEGVGWVRFDVTGESHQNPWHEVRVSDLRIVRSSNGEEEKRFVVSTQLELAGLSWPIEVTLTNRERMELPMLIGREALAGHVLVDPERSSLWGRPGASRKRKRAPRKAAVSELIR